MPAALRYAPLIGALGDAARAIPKELEIYATPTPPPDYTIEREIAGIARAADAVGWERFHLYGHSAGGACALAFAAAHPERVLTLALDEPASDFSAEDRRLLRRDLDAMAGLPDDDRVAAFLRGQVAPGVDLPAPPAGSPPAWMASQRAGIDAFVGALPRHRLRAERLRAFRGPVYFSHGSLSHPRWVAMRDRLAGIFPDFAAEVYEGAHHLDTSHMREPARVAAALVRLWSRAGEEQSRAPRAAGARPDPA
jgi:pimeloyl-ACP methyl ester carboxylesterase